jgi:hypothetical protein
MRLSGIRTTKNQPEKIRARANSTQGNLNQTKKADGNKEQSWLGSVEKERAHEMPPQVYEKLARTVN